jgi:hypothetical protein
MYIEKNAGGPTNPRATSVRLPFTRDAMQCALRRRIVRRTHERRRRQGTTRERGRQRTQRRKRQQREKLKGRVEWVRGACCPLVRERVALLVVRRSPYSCLWCGVSSPISASSPSAAAATDDKRRTQRRCTGGHGKRHSRRRRRAWATPGAEQITATRSGRATDRSAREVGTSRTAGTAGRTASANGTASASAHSERITTVNIRTEGGRCGGHTECRRQGAGRRRASPSIEHIT